jgi:putative membrane-bound dehydrogenase-like protein
MRPLPLALALALASVASAQEQPPPTGFQNVTLNGQTFTLPDGFTIELAAKSPQVDRPVTMALDDQGRLYVADSSGDNSPPAEQVKKPTHRVVRLESSKKDGVYDKSVVFADKLSFLQGTMWHKGSLYVAAPPKVIRLTDTDGDGVADKRETWFDGGTLTGCANDLHGPYLGPDGLFYWTKGAFAKQDLKLKGGKTLTTRAAHVFRATPDATDIEVVMTGGMDNPVGVAFLPTGETFVSCTFVQHPAGGKRDAILHCAYGAIYGKDHDPIREQPWTDTTFTEPMTHLGPAAPAGLHAYRSTHFGKDFTGNLFCAQFNMAKVSRHVLKPKGATFETADTDFVKSDSKDFHPTDVIEDADGSLLIADTGGWYKLCCPSSVLEKKDVLGAIYRVRKVNGEKARPVAWPPIRAMKPDPLRLDLRVAETIGRGDVADTNDIRPTLQSCGPRRGR